MKVHNKPNLIQSMIIFDRFEKFPYSSPHTPNFPNFSYQKELIQICYPRLNSKVEEYGKPRTSVDKLQNPSQIQKVSRKLFNASRETIKNLKKDEFKVLKMIYDFGITNFRNIDFESLEERVAIMAESNVIKGKNISLEFVDRLAFELRNTPNLEKYFPKYR